MNYLRPEIVQSLKLKQVLYEINGWKRTLAFMMDENIHLKSRLSEVIQNKLHKQFLIHIEGYQNNFVKQDDLIGLLRNDIAALEKLLTGSAHNYEVDVHDVEGKLFILRNNIGLAQTQFDMQKNEFNSFLLENL